jgi:RNA polymerase sigma-70 factor (ECF subfamily)
MNGNANRRRRRRATQSVGMRVSTQSVDTRERSSGFFSANREQHCRPTLYQVDARTDACVEPTDEQLARDAMAGDKSAFAALVERLRGPLIGFVTGLVGRRDDAEELAQEALLVAWQKLPGLREPAHVGGWIYRIAERLALAHVRRPRMVPLDADPPARACDDDARADADAALVALLAAVTRLSEPHREVIARKHFAGASGEEIAAQLGIPPGTVRSRLSRAYAELRAILEPSGE